MRDCHLATRIFVRNRGQRVSIWAANFKELSVSKSQSNKRRTTRRLSVPSVPESCPAMADTSRDVDDDLPTADGSARFRIEPELHPGLYLDDDSDGYPRFFALEIAKAFLAQNETTDPSEILHIQECAMLIGEHVAQLGHPGDWSKFEAVHFFENCPPMDRRELVPVTLSVICLIGWLGGMGQMAPGPCIRIMREIADAGPQEPCIRDFAVSGQELVHHMSLSGEEVYDYVN